VCINADLSPPTSGKDRETSAHNTVPIEQAETHPVCQKIVERTPEHLNIVRDLSTAGGQ
jgi:hypothetical protein